LSHTGRSKANTLYLLESAGPGRRGVAGESPKSLNGPDKKERVLLPEVEGIIFHGGEDEGGGGGKRARPKKKYKMSEKDPRIFRKASNIKVWVRNGGERCRGFSSKKEASGTRFIPLRDAAFTERGL